MNENNTPNSNWTRLVLKLAGAYNLLWGAWVVLFPNAFFVWAEMEVPNYPAIWQSVGMVVGCYGLAYWLASYNPYKHWAIILVGFLGKLCGPIGLMWAYWQGSLPLIFGVHNIGNDVIWLVPFAVILYKAYRANGWRLD
jgi:small multidrug resistance pump